MAGPFYNAISGITASAAGTGAYTPSGANAGHLGWSMVPVGWIGLARFDDGADWELSYCYWNGTTLSRGVNQFVAGSTGALLSLTSAATATLVADGLRLNAFGMAMGRGLLPNPGANTMSMIGYSSPSVSGVQITSAISATNFLTQQPRIKLTSSTTADALAGVSVGASVFSSSTPGRGGGMATARFGFSALPTGRRQFFGFTTTSYGATPEEPSAFPVNMAIFGTDSTDTNIQLMTNQASGSATKINTGIALAANGWYEANIWMLPGSTTVYGLLVRMDTGQIFYTSTNTNVPAPGLVMQVNCLGRLSATAGTAIVLEYGGMWVRSGGL